MEHDVEQNVEQQNQKSTQFAAGLPIGVVVAA
jgi:hypothetical protein